MDHMLNQKRQHQAIIKNETTGVQIKIEQIIFDRKGKQVY